MTTRKETIGNATLYLGDCREILPTLSGIFTTITDPPYGIKRGGQKQSRGKHGGRKAYEFLGWDEIRPCRQTFDLLLGTSRDHVIWGGNYFADFLPPRGKWLVWDKGQRINQSDGELAWTSAEGALRIFTLNRVAIMKDGAEHPTQKPVELMRWSIQQIESRGTILDPFMGSGSTGVAAINMGRKFIGIEREPSYFEIACRRIKAEVDAPRMFTDEASTEQETLPL